MDLPPKSILERLTGHAPHESDPSEADGEAADSHASFGWLRGVRDRAQMLELRKRDGSIKAVSYGWLDSVLYEPGEGIVLSIAGSEIRITGRNLNAEVRPNLRLLMMLARHRVLWIQEADRTVAMSAEKEMLVVEEIRW